MSRIGALIVDDEPLARRRLQRLLEQRPDVTVAGECRSGPEAVAAIREGRPELVFLDVQMPGLDGVGVLETVGLDAVGAVIFVTAYDRYALQAFDLHAVDYLLKPFTDDRFHRALDRALVRLRRAAAESLSDSVLAAVERYRSLQQGAPPIHTPSRPDEEEKLVIKSTGRVRFLPLADIDWLEAAGSYVRVHAGGQTRLLRESLTRLAQRLPESRFVRIHRSAIVHVDRVVELRHQSHREMTLMLRDGTELKLSRTYRDRAAPFLGLPG